MNWLALDIGGANLKAADGLGWATSQPFALWKHPDQLPAAISQLQRGAPRFEQIAVTMTGELCDCYATKADGVAHILSSVEEASAGCPIWVYLTDGRLVTTHEARERPMLAAASNWHAMAAFAGRFAPQGPALLIDVGSTTSDVIPLFQGKPLPTAITDTERLCSGELVYTGVIRTPLCAILASAPWRGRTCSLAGELFATAWDAYLVLGDLTPEPERHDTADGRAATVECAINRLARSICADATEFSPQDALQLAQAVAHKQRELLSEAASRVLRSRGVPETMDTQATVSRDTTSSRVSRLPAPHTIIVSGCGEFLASRVVTRCFGDRARQVSLSALLGPHVSQAAPAHALAVLAREADRHVARS